MGISLSLDLKLPEVRGHVSFILESATYYLLTYKELVSILIY